MAAAFLSGCFGDSGGDGDEPPSDGGTGILAGRVVEAGGLPLAGATVRDILSGNRSTLTDANGTYTILDVPAGLVRLVANAPGHVAATREVDVLAGHINVVDFDLHPAQVEPAPRTTPLDFPGSLSCSLPGAGACGTTTGVDDNVHLFLVEEGLAGIVVEVVWTPTLAGTAAQLAATVRAANATTCGQDLPGATGTGTSPLRFDVDSGFYTRGGHQCLVVTVPKGEAVANQAYHAYVTLFYHGPPPEGYSRLPS